MSRNRTSRHRLSGRFLALAVPMLLAPGIARAEVDLTRLPLEKLLEMRVIAASSYEQTAIEAPSAVSVITADDIRSRGYRTLGAALQSMPGLYLTDDQSYAYLGSRGFNRIGDYNSRFQLSVNGLRTNDALYDMAYVGSEFPLDMSLIERIEFAPGPGSSVYGGNAMLGVINIVTRRGADLGGWRIAPAIGSDGLGELVVSYGKRYASGLEVLASASGMRTDGQDFHFPAFDTPGNRGGIAAGQNAERYRRGYLRATYGGFDFETVAGVRNKVVPSVYADSDFLSPENRVVDRLRFTVLRYQRDLGASTRLEANVNAGRYDYAGTYPMVGGYNNRDDVSGRWKGGELRLLSTYWEGHKLVVGAEMQRSTLDQRNTDPGVVYLDRRDYGRRYGILIQDEWHFMEGWLLNAGVRYDHHYSFGASTNPRLALIGTIAPGTTLKLLYGSAFRAPNAYELYYVNATEATPAHIGPERSRSVEAVLEQQLGDRWRWRASLFRYQFADLIDQVQTETAIAFVNRGKVTGRGAELALTALLPASIRATASVSLHQVFDDEGLRLTNSPRYTAKLTLQAPLADSGIDAALDWAVVGARLDRDRNPVRTSITGNVVFTTHRPWHGAIFSAGVYNLLDRRNMEPVSEYFAQAQVPVPARHFRLGAEWQF